MRPKLTCVTVRSRPAFQTCLISIAVARVMSEELVSRPAKLIAAKTVVVLVTNDSDLILELCYGAVVSQLLPVRARVDHARVRRLFY